MTARLSTISGILPLPRPANPSSTPRNHLHLIPHVSHEPTIFRQPLASTPSSDLRSLFQTTLYDYEKRTGTNLVEHQLAIDLSSCATTDSIIVTLRSNLQTLKTFRVEDTAVIIKWIKRIARHLAAVSTHGVLGGEGSRVLSTPESALLSAIGILVVPLDDR
ncbi:hypothetical protein B0F90DRAFT_277682 [Multifurca ochricompacta]|uniref:Uncharacterized protein n=1 Tax=Multifurca ochricompacta TaxID=376703 RepID=A0AAD4QJN2_9AGAM|nr:hypothetical protein B0F90DRAFT_277682 [Multifurca ochricompacta]